MEAFCELFFDNLATLLGVTGSAVAHIGYGIIAAPWRQTPAAYNFMIAEAWEKMYFEVGLAQGFPRLSFTSHPENGFQARLSYPASVVAIRNFDKQPQETRAE